MLLGFRARATTAGFAVTVTIVAAGLTAGCSSGPDPAGPLRSFAAALSKNDIGRLKPLDDQGRPLAGADAQRMLETLAGDLKGTVSTVKLVGEPKENGKDASAKASVSWRLAPGVEWGYSTTLRARISGGRWRVVFDPATVHPDLSSTDRLSLRRTPAPRGAILDGSGGPIVAERPVVIVGVQPSEVTDASATVAQLTAIINKVEPGLAFTELPAKIAAAKPDAFVEVVTLRREKYDQVRPELRAMESTHFQEATLPLAPTSTFARALLGSTGEVTKEIMEKNPGKYQVGDIVGLSGLQLRYDDALRGTPGLSVTISGSSGGNGRELFAAPPKAGAAVKISLDQKTQTAADAALASETRNTALVAIRISDGAILAVANGASGPNKGQLDLGLTARVPPGSTFKTITALGVLDSGAATADTIVGCPKTFPVGGTSYKNAHDGELGEVPLHVDFAHSCNTAFAALAPKLGPDGLAKTAATLGIGARWSIGTDVYTGKVSSGGSEAEQAAAAFGQGTTTVSPAALAGAAAAIARGRWRQPTLVIEPAPRGRAPDGPELKVEAVSALRGMMREVVTAGTATALKDSGEVYGKTGTAEFDSNDLSKTHSWFMGYRGDVAFALLVEAGGTSTDIAVPLAVAFLKNLG